MRAQAESYCGCFRSSVALTGRCCCSGQLQVAYYTAHDSWNILASNRQRSRSGWRVGNSSCRCLLASGGKCSPGILGGKGTCGIFLLAFGVWTASVLVPSAFEDCLGRLDDWSLRLGCLRGARRLHLAAAVSEEFLSKMACFFPRGIFTHFLSDLFGECYCACAATLITHTTYMLINYVCLSMMCPGLLACTSRSHCHRSPPPQHLFSNINSV